MKNAAGIRRAAETLLTNPTLAEMEAHVRGEVADLAGEGSDLGRALGELYGSGARLAFMSFVAAQRVSSTFNHGTLLRAQVRFAAHNLAEAIASIPGTEIVHQDLASAVSMEFEEVLLDALATAAAASHLRDRGDA